MDVPTLTTRRFTMRSLIESDAKALFPTFSSADQCRFMSQPHFEDIATFSDWLNDKEWPGQTWIAIDRVTEEVAGRYIAFPGRDDAVLELGYITATERQRQGVARECMTALIAHIFTMGRYRKLYMEIDAENRSSIALAESLGFLREAYLRQHETTHNGVCDLLVYGLLIREWRQRQGEAS